MKRTFDETELALAIFSVLYKQDIAKKAEVDLDEVKLLEAEYKTGRVSPDRPGRNPYREPARPDGDRLDVLKARLEDATGIMYELEAPKRLCARELAEAAFAMQLGTPISRYTSTDLLKKVLGEVTGQQGDQLDHISDSLGYGPRLLHDGHQWKTPIGFGPVIVDKGLTMILTVQPQLPVALQMVAIHAEVARHFQINDVRIGKNSQLVTAGAIDASLICLMQLNGMVANVGQMVSLNLTNMDPVHAHEFKAAILCDVRE
jgi:hypothetical protein